MNLRPSPIVLRHERQLGIGPGEVPGQRCGCGHCIFVGLLGDDSRTRIVENDAQLAFVLAAELAYFQRPRFGAGFPVHVAGRIFRSVLANEVQVVAASAGEGFKFASDQRENFEEFVCRPLPADTPGSPALKPRAASW